MIEQNLLQEFKISLEKERSLLTAELTSIADPDPKMKGDWHARFPKFEIVETSSSSDREVEADEIEEYEMRLAEEQSLESRLLAVTKALERISNGTYGSCKTCGKAIAIDRLRANPAAEHDMAHSV